MSHFVTHADWGFHDGEYKAWLVAGNENKKEAMQILPSAYRHSANLSLFFYFLLTRSRLVLYTGKLTSPFFSPRLTAL